MVVAPAMKLCPTCKGGGLLEYQPNIFRACYTCNGRGWV